MSQRRLFLKTQKTNTKHHHSNSPKQETTSIHKKLYHFVLCQLLDGGANTKLTILKSSQYPEVPRTSGGYQNSHGNCRNAGEDKWQCGKVAHTPGFQIQSHINTKSAALRGFGLITGRPVSRLRNVWGSFVGGKSSKMKVWHIGSISSLGSLPEL